MIAADGQTWFAWHSVAPCPEPVREWDTQCVAV
jgi:hypothetical protein